MTIYVFGSLNMDLVCRTPRLPATGETILGQSFTTVPGGKGANQAVAAARLGAAVAMVGRVGPDEFGQALLASLQAAGVEGSAVVQDRATHTGIASIVVDAAGRNQIVVVPGANGRVNQVDGERLLNRLQPRDYVLLQFEIPLPVVMATAAAARQAGAVVMVDPAPAVAELPTEFLAAISILTPNQVEASQLIGQSIDSLEAAHKAAYQLQQRGPETVILKLGPQGVIAVTPQGCWHQPAPAVAVVDTVAAGDAFNGGLAVARSEGMDWPTALKFATATAAWSVTQAGAQAAMPRREQVEQLLPQVAEAGVLER